MADKHTPGPWGAFFSPWRAKGRRRWSLEAVGPRPVGPHRGWLGDLILTEDHPDAEQDANAQLIGVSPELLAALEAVVAKAYVLPDTRSEEAFPECVFCGWACAEHADGCPMPQVLAVINKAKGVADTDDNAGGLPDQP